MTDLDIPALKAAALAATPGQWARNVAGIEHDNYIAGTGPWYRLHKGGADMASADAAYIALANPATILALIERLERAEKNERGRVVQLRAAHDQFDVSERKRHEWQRAAEDWASRYNDLTAERERLVAMLVDWKARLAQALAALEAP